MPVPANLAELTRRVESEFRARAGELGPERAAVRARFVLNRGGFTNRSFTADDGRQRLHVKLTSNARSLDKLRRWRHGVRARRMSRWAGGFRSPVARDSVQGRGT